MYKKIRKKILIFSIMFLIILSKFYVCLADDFILDEFSENSSGLETFETSSAVSNTLQTYSRNIIAIDRKTLSVLYEKNAYDKTPMASTTKIMTCIIALENCSLNDIVLVSTNSAKVSGSVLGLTQNMQITMNDLLYGLMLRSRKRLCYSNCRTY